MQIRSAADRLVDIQLHVTSQERVQFRQMGFVLIRGLLGPCLSSALEREAIASVEQAKVPRDGWTTELRKRERETPARQTARRPAKVLAQLQAALVPLLRTLTGQLLAPSYAWYNYYEGTDGIWLHVDPQESDLSVLTTVLGEVGPLHLHPELKGQSQDQLDTYYQGVDWDPDSGVPVCYPRDGILVSRGQVIPHHRSGKPIVRRCAVAAMHYAFPW